MMTQKNFASGPVVDDARFLPAAAYEREGDLWASVNELKILSHDFPKSDLAAKGILKVAEFLVSQGKSDDAKNELIQSVEAAGPTVYKNLMQKKLAEILKAQGHARESIFYFSEALKNTQGDVACEIQFELAEALESQGEMEKAASEFLKVSYLYPTNMLYPTRAQLRAAKIFEDLSKYHEALKVYERIAHSSSNQADFAKERIRKITSVLEQGR